MRRPFSFLAVLALAFSLIPAVALAAGVCGDPFTPIYDIQGSGSSSPAVGSTVTTEGVVTVDLQKNNEHEGFFIQDLKGDGNDATSDGLFISHEDDDGADVSVGDVVRVEGEIFERFSQTQMGAFFAPASVDVCGTAKFKPLRIKTRDFNANPEQYEGMYLQYKGSLFVTDTFNLHRFGEIWLGDDGVIEQPTNEFPGGSAAMLAFALDNMDQSVLLEDGSRFSNPNPVPFVHGGGTLRLGDRTKNPTGAIQFSFGEYKMTNSTDPVFKAKNKRPGSPDVDGDVVVASFNVLNYWTTLGGRGASNAPQLAAQQDKLVAAIRGMDADIVGLQEIENDDPTDTPIITLVAALNAAEGANVWSRIDGFNQNIYPIVNEIIYRNDRVTPVRAAQTLADPAFDECRFNDCTNPNNQLGRRPVAQAFEVDGEVFTVMVNHFKSKSSTGATGADTDQGDGQSAFNARRVRQAEAILGWIPVLQAAADDPDVLVIGDLNAYPEEDPILTLETGLENALREEDDDPYSFNFFARFAAPFIGRGSLDHALATSSMADQVDDAMIWHINADEPRFLDWFDPSRLAPGPYRSSDHDPVLIGLELESDDDDEDDEDDEDVEYTLVVLHNNDGESDLLPDDSGAGSISRFGKLLRSQRRMLDRGEERGVIAITAGDNFLASPEFSASLDNGVPFFDAIALDRIGYDGYTIGNHEFDFGPSVLADFINSFSNCERNPFLSANLIFDAEPALAALVDRGCIKSSIVERRDGEKIGIIGLTTPELREISSPGNVEILTDLAGIANAEAERLTNQGVEMIILVSHLQDIDNEVALVPELRNIDAVIGGGGGERLSAPLSATTADGFTIPVVTVPGDYFDLGRLILEFDDDGELLDFSWDLLPVTGDLSQDPFLVNEVEVPVAAFVDELDQTVIATSGVPLNGVRAQVRTRETNVGNLLSDSFVATTQARAPEFGLTLVGPIVGLQNGGGIRNDAVIPAGDVTLLDTFDIAPFTNFVSVLPDVEPADLIAAIEHGLSGLPGSAGSFAQWSGLEVQYDPAAPAGSRIVDLTVNGVLYVDNGVVQAGLDPVDIATIDFLAAGNDGYDMFETYTFTRVGTSYQQSLANILAVADLSTTSTEYKPRGAVADRTRVIPIP